MNVRYNPILGGGMIAMGTLNVLLAGVSGAMPGMLTGFIVGAMGVLYLIRVWFTVGPEGIELAALIGPLVKRYPGTPREFRIDGGRLVSPEGKTVARRRKPVPSRLKPAAPPWGAGRSPWGAMSKGSGPRRFRSA